MAIHAATFLQALLLADGLTGRLADWLASLFSSSLSGKPASPSALGNARMHADVQGSRLWPPGKRGGGFDRQVAASDALTIHDVNNGSGCEVRFRPEWGPLAHEKRS